MLIAGSARSETVEGGAAGAVGEELGGRRLDLHQPERAGRRGARVELRLGEDHRRDQRRVEVLDPGLLADQRGVGERQCQVAHDALDRRAAPAPRRSRPRRAARRRGRRGGASARELLEHGRELRAQLFDVAVVDDDVARAARLLRLGQLARLALRELRLAARGERARRGSRRRRSRRSSRVKRASPPPSNSSGASTTTARGGGSRCAACA